MSIADHYRRKCEQIRKEIANLQKQKAAEVKKGYDAARKANDAQRTLKNTRSQSTISSKLRQIEGYKRDRERAESKIANLEQKNCVWMLLFYLKILFH